MKTKIPFLLALLAFLIPATLFAAESRKDELRKRFQERYADIQKLKQDGTIGETDEGYVDFVEGKDKAKATLVDEENKDRKELYQIIAKAESTDVGTVAKHNAQRNFEKAKKGEYLRVGGKWHQKADDESDKSGGDDKAKKKPKKSGD